jgi:DNA-binding transcriptional LysR family regulator
MHPHLDNRLRAKLRFRHIELIDALGDTLNIHRAAPRLNLSQPSTSKLLHEVEEIYGTPLFERLPRGLRATTAGAVAVRWARLLMQQMGESVAEARLVASGATGRVRLGALPVALPTLVNVVLQRVRAELPDLVVTVTEGTNEMLLPALARNELDLVLCRMPQQTQAAVFISERLYDEPLRLVVRKKHPLLRKRNLSTNDLTDVQWVLPPELAPVRRELELVLAECGLRRPNPRLETTSQMLVEIVLNQTDLVAAMPFSVAQLYQSRGQLAILNLVLPINMPPVGLLLHAAALHSPSVEAVIRLVRQVGELHRGAGKGADCVECPV